MANANTVPGNWSNDDVVEGLDILDKAELVNVPFRINGCVFTTNNDNVSICYIDAENASGYEFTFIDSSTGVRAQIVKYLTDKGLDAGIESGEYIEFKLVAPQGLRLSEYEVPVRGTNGQAIAGKNRMARTYYLTANGTRGARGKAKEAAPKAAPKAARTA